MANANPFLEVDDKGEPLTQLKLSVIFYLDYAPGPKRARRVYDLYMKRFGQEVRVFQSTSWLGPPDQWNELEKRRFEGQSLANLQKQDDWGYAFADGKSVDCYLFMFHGYRPVTQPGRASFFRFEWPWNTDTEQIVAFAGEVADTVPFLSGTGGYIISARPLEASAYDRMFAFCRRFWGLEAWNLDLTVRYVLHGYKCPSWLTLIGNRLLDQYKDRRPDLDAIARYAIARANGVMYVSRKQPEFIDQNRQESCVGEQAIARALLPLQITQHEDFGGTAWRGRTMEWLRRFAL